MMQPELDFSTQEVCSSRLKAILARRGIREPADIHFFLNAGLADLHDPFLMKGMREAVERIQRAVRDGEEILVHGDYDADGVTSTAILSRTLDRLGARYRVFLPDRLRDGYGVSEAAVREAISAGIRFLITADCGITAHVPFAFARSRGVDILVLDHHRIPDKGLPPATVILNPLQEDCPYPFKELSAGGLAFKLSQALLGAAAFDFLGLAAISTVADVAPLLGENRILVRYGLEQLSERGDPGLRALAEVASIRTRKFHVSHVGFMLAPRLNAAGRMSTPETALRLLVTTHEDEATSLARLLDEENKARQKEERLILQEAVREVERTFNFNRDRVVVVGKAGWHPGIVGIVASRLVDRYYRPAIVIGFERGWGRGSGRSIKNFHLFNAMASCRGLFEEFGGHEQAAGLVMREENLTALRREINRYAIKNYAPELFEREVQTDLSLNLTDLKTPFLDELTLLEPHGVGNPRPVFETRHLWVKGRPRCFPRPDGTSNWVKFWVTDGEAVFEASAVDYDQNLSWLAEGKRLDLAYTIKSYTSYGLPSITLEVKSLKPAI